MKKETKAAFHLPCRYLVAKTGEVIENKLRGNHMHQIDRKAVWRQGRPRRAHLPHAAHKEG